MGFLVSTENTKNEILLFSVYGLCGKIFSLKMKIEIQSNTFLLPFSILSENENRKQSNQTTSNIFPFKKFCCRENIILLLLKDEKFLLKRFKYIFSYLCFLLD